MLHIHCPYCRESRSEEEFAYGGEAHIQRPSRPAQTSEREWGDYLHFRKGTRGVHREMWFHVAGCRRYFNVVRDTVSYAILKTYAMGEEP